MMEGMRFDNSFHFLSHSETLKYLFVKFVKNQNFGWSFDH